MLKERNMIKEALDNLPMGIGFFDKNGVPLLINKKMHSLSFLLNKRDLQSLSELDGIFEKPDEVMTGDGKVWRFKKRTIADNITEVTAADITELYRKKRELMRKNAEQRKIMKQLDKLGQNVVSITRSEEILAMKMKIHNDLGYSISSIRRFIKGDFSQDEKREFIDGQRKMAKILLNEATSGDDEPDVFAELKESVRKLGMDIVFDGELPQSAENIMTKTIRECLINTVRHAGGDKVFVKSKLRDGIYTAAITNDGAAPDGMITESGGLLSLRESIEAAGGSMNIESAPVFKLSIELPL